MMRDRIKTLLLFLAIISPTFMAVFMLTRGASAEQSGSFSGNWTASGQSETFDFVKGRAVGTFKLAGNIFLNEEFAGIADFWAECVGLSDSVSGISVRCVWRNLKGEKAYSVLSGQALEEGVKVSGEFVGGTDRLKGLTGTFEFSWKHTYTDRNQGMFTGFTQDLNGTYKIP